jgi:hypothetical protein
MGWESWLGIFLTGLMGVSLGLLGGGGSILAVPIMVYLFHLDAHAAITLSLVLVGGTALLAALVQHRDTNVDWRGGTVFAALGAPFSLLGSFGARKVPGGMLLFAFGMLMLVVGAMMLRGRHEPPADAPRDWRRVAASGMGVGLLTGFLGVGGGFLIVPALALLTRMPMKVAIGTSLLVIAGNCAFALAGRWDILRMSWTLLALLGPAALAGMLLGVRLCGRLNAAQLRRLFGAFVIAVGLWMAFQNAAGLLR